MLSPPQNIIVGDYRGSRDSFISLCCCFHVFIVSTGAVPGSAHNLVSVYYTDVKRQPGSVKETNCLLAPLAETQNELEGATHTSLENIFLKNALLFWIIGLITSLFRNWTDFLKQIYLVNSENRIFFFLHISRELTVTHTHTHTHSISVAHTEIQLILNANPVSFIKSQ